VKILQLIDTLKPGGAERMCVNIANTMFTKGYEVVVCSTHSGGNLQKQLNPQIKYYCLGKKGFADIIAFKKLLEIVDSEKTEVIHAHSSSIFWAIAAKIFKPKLKAIWHDHFGLKVYERKRSFFYRLLSFKIDGIISVNSNLETWSKKNMHVPDDRIILINNFSYLPKKEKKTINGAFTIVCLANIRPQKDHGTLIKAIDLVLKKRTDQKFKLILAGQYSEDDYFLNINKLIKELNLESIIEFAGPVEDVADLLAKADCGVLSSISEGLPVSLLEYGMAALPVVVTDVGQCAEVVGFGKFGKVVPPQKPDIFADELISIINYRQESFEMGINFKNNVDKYYSPEGFMKEFKMLIDKIEYNA
jgi:glycosyltransferase involved in cell wall biosynthesis